MGKNKNINTVDANADLPLDIKKLMDFKAHTNEGIARFFMKRFTQKIIALKSSPKSKYPDTIFIYNNKYKYYKPTNEGTISVFISDLIHKTFEPMTDQANEEIKFLNKKKAENEGELSSKDTSRLHQLSYNIEIFQSIINKIETTIFKEKVVIELLKLVETDEEKIRRPKNYLQFKNCQINLETYEISDRTEQDFVTEFLNFNYEEEVSEEINNEVKTMIKQICNNNDEDYKFIMSYLGYSITEETKETKFLNVIGPSASNGKSTLIKIMSSVFDIYCYKADKRLFNESYSKAHKCFSEMKNIRIGYIEEVDRNRMDVDLLKDVVDGDKLNIEVLFKTTEKIEILFKLLFFSNNLMNISSDEGIKRRILPIFFNSRFVDEKDYKREKENYKKGEVFIKDYNILNKFKNNNEYKNAFTHLIIHYAKRYFKRGLYIPDKITQLSESLIDDNAR